MKWWLSVLFLGFVLSGLSARGQDPFAPKPVTLAEIAERDRKLAEQVGIAQSVLETLGEVRSLGDKATPEGLVIDRADPLKIGKTDYDRAYRVLGPVRLEIRGAKVEKRREDQLSDFKWELPDFKRLDFSDLRIEAEDKNIVDSFNDKILARRKTVSFMQYEHLPQRQVDPQTGEGLVTTNVATFGMVRNLTITLEYRSLPGDPQVEVLKSVGIREIAQDPRDRRRPEPVTKYMNFELKPCKSLQVKALPSSKEKKED